MQTILLYGGAILVIGTVTWKMGGFGWFPTEWQHDIWDKQPVFSFNKFPNVNKQLGPEMKSTGESILFIDSLKDDEFYNLYTRRKMYLSK